MFKKALTILLIFLIFLTIGNTFASNDDLSISLDPNGWNGSGVITYSYPNSSLVWQPVNKGSYMLTKNIPTNWNIFNCIKFDCYSQTKTNSWVYVFIKTKGNGYLYTYLIIDWTGWKNITLTFNDIFSSFAKVGNPDLRNVDYFSFQSHPEANLQIDKCLIYISELRLSYDNRLEVKNYNVDLMNSKDDNIMFSEEIIIKIKELIKDEGKSGIKGAFEEITRNAEKLSIKEINLSIIRDAALLGRITNDKLMNKSVINVLSSIDENYWDNLMRENDIYIQEELINYVITYDLLRNEINTNSQLLSKVQKMLEYLAKIELDVCKYWISYYPYGKANNHVTRAAVAAGIASIAMDKSSSNREEILNLSLFILDNFFDFQISEDGVLNEGTHYYTYLMEIISYFAHFLKNTSGMNIFTDFPFSIKLRSLVEWSVKIRMPNGYLPCIDDSWQDRVIYPLRFVADLLPNSNLLNWSSVNVYSSTSIVNEPWNLVKSLYIPIYLATYKNELETSQPLIKPSMMFPSDSEIVFRENWSKNSAYLFLTGKSLFSLHEHDETGNIQIYAYNSPIITTSGYGPSGWSSTNRKYYVSSSAHNVIQVDGIGPKSYYNGGVGPIDTSSISDFKSFSKFDFANLRIGFDTSFEDTYWDRYIFFVKNSNNFPFYTIVIDNLNSNKDRVFTANFHPAGNLYLRKDKTVEYRSNNLYGEDLTTRVEPIFDCDTEICNGYYSSYWGEEKETKYLKYILNGKNAIFGTAIFPYLRKKPEEFQTQSYKNGVAVEFNVAIENKDRKFTDFFTLDESKSIKQLKYTGSNSRLSYIRKNEQNNLIDTFFLEDGSYLNLNQKEMFYSNKNFNYFYFSSTENLYKYYCEFELNYSQAKTFINITDFEYALLDGKEIKYERTKKGIFLDLQAGKHILTFK